MGRQGGEAASGSTGERLLVGRQGGEAASGSTGGRGC